MTLSGCTVLLVSTHRWSHNRYSKQHVASALSKRNRVLYVEPEADGPAFPRKTRLFRPPDEEGDLLVATPTTTPGLSRWDFVHRLRTRDLVIQFRSLVSRFRSGPLVLWIYRPDFVFLLDVFPGRDATVYHCVDRHAVLFPPDMRAQVEQDEKRLANEADLCIAVSEPLREWLGSLGAMATVVSNGVSERLFDAKPDARFLQEFRRPLVLSHGSFDDSMDPDAFREAAKRNAHATFVHVGPIAETHTREAEHLRSEVGVVLVEPQPWSQMPGILACADVLITVFRDIDYNRHGGSPLRLLEGLAAGKPVAKSGVPVDTALVDLVYFGRTPQEFAHAVSLALAEPLEDPRRALRVAATRERTWERQVALMERHLLSRLRSRVERCAYSS